MKKSTRTVSTRHGNMVSVRVADGGEGLGGWLMEEVWVAG